MLSIALTHKSANPDKSRATFFRSYESLEFLGDAVHKFLVVKLLSNILGAKKYESNQRLFDTITGNKAIAESNNLLAYI